MPLNLPGLVMDEARCRENGIVTLAVKRRPEARKTCPECGGDLRPNGTRLVTYADLPSHGKPTEIEWDRQRFACKACGKTFADEHHGLHAQFLMTQRLYDWIGKRSLTHTFASVAADVGVDERTVRRVFTDWAPEKLAEMHFATPKWLGMDEIHLLKGPRGVLTNVSERTMIDLLPNRNYPTVARRIAQMPNLNRVEVVAMDMWHPYRRVARDMIPHAAIVVDKWHVLSKANAALEIIRKKVRSRLSIKRRRRLMHDRFVLLTREKRLRPDQRIILEAWCNEFPMLGAAWRAKEGFYRLYEEQTTRKGAELAYAVWEASLKGKTLQAAFALVTGPLTNPNPEKNWREEFFAYWDCPVTNAYTESLNRLIGDADRIGRGYSFDVLRTRMLLAKGALKEEGLPAGTFGWSPDRDQVLTGIHIPTLAEMIKHGHF